MTHSLRSASAILASCLVSLVVCTNAFAAVAFDAATEKDVKSSSTSWSHTVGAGSNRLLLVGISDMDKSGVTGVTYGGVSLAYVGQATNNSCATLALYRLVAPATGTATINVTLNHNDDLVAGAMSFSGVDQGAPLGAVAFSSGTGTTISTTVASRTNDMVADFGCAATTPTVDPGQTSRWNVQQSRYGIGSTKPGASSVTMTWTQSSAAWIQVAVNVRAATADAGQFVSGSYTGNATDNTAISREVGFEPDVVFVKGETTQEAVVHTTTMNGDLTKPLVSSTALTADLIQTLDATAGQALSHGGFTVGTDARVNSNTLTYDFVALTAKAGEVFIGSYVGTGSSTGMIGVGFQPDVVMIFSDLAVAAVFRTSSMASNVVVPFTNGASVASCINTLDSDGFTVTTDTRCNGSDTTYHYVAWKATTSKLAVGSYTGVSGNDNRDIALAAGFGTPDWVLIKTATAVDGVHKMAVTGQSTDSACYFRNIVCAADTIQALQTDGFQVGTTYNANAVVYYYVAFSHRSTATAVRLARFTATFAGDGNTLLQWRTGYEVDNLGFNVYRDDAGVRTRLTPKLIGGSGLLRTPATQTHASFAYQWVDTTPIDPTKPVTYWLEDVDLNGTRTLHGPLVPVTTPSSRP